MIAPSTATSSSTLGRIPVCRSVLMVGADQSDTGGLASIVRGYFEGGLFERVTGTYVAMQTEGTGWERAWAGLTGWGQVAKLLATAQAPLLHIHLASHAAFWRKSIVTRLARLGQRPYVLHVHGPDFVRFFEEECGARAQALIRSTFARAAAVLAMSEDWRANLWRICPQANVLILPKAVPVPPTRANLSVAPETRLLFLGRLGHRKGTFDLMHAFAKVAPRHPTARLVLAGDGAIDEARALAQSLGLADRILVPGWLAADAGKLELQRAQVFVLPSRAEGLPVALLEAMSWGLPVVTTSVSGIRQVVKHGENGLVVQPGDVPALASALDQLLRNPGMRQTLGDGSRATIEQKHSLGAAIEALLRLYASFGIEVRPRRTPVQA